MDESSSSHAEMTYLFQAFGIPATVTPKDPEKRPYRTLVIPRPHHSDDFPVMSSPPSDEEIRARRRVIFDEQVEAAWQRHEKEQNPFAPWQVYYAARALGHQIPPWVLAHFDGIADTLARLRVRGKIDRSEIAQALSFATRRGPTRGAKAARDRALAAQVAARVSAGMSVKAAEIEVAQDAKVGISTVERAWRASKSRPERLRFIFPKVPIRRR